MGLTREEKENLVLDLYYNEGKTYAEIAKEARISLRDIGPILKKSGTEQSLSNSSQAYLLFSEGKTPIQVAIGFAILILLSTTASLAFSTAHAQTNVTTPDQTGKTSSTTAAQSEQASKSIRGAIISTWHFLNNATQEVVRRQCDEMKSLCDSTIIRP